MTGRSPPDQLQIDLERPDEDLETFEEWITRLPATPHSEETQDSTAARQSRIFTTRPPDMG